MKPILIIAPNSNIFKLSKKVAKNYKDVAVQLGLIDKAVEIAQNAEQTGAEVLVSRGITSNILKEKLTSAFLVEMVVSSYDVLSTIHSAKKYGKNIVVIGFKSIVQEVERISPILDINIKACHIEHEEEGEIYLKHIINSGEKIDVLLGGTVAENLASKYGINTIYLETGEAAIEKSIKEATKILEVSRKEKEKTEQFKAILQNISQGVISINVKNEVTTFNSAAEKIMGISERNILSKPIVNFMPDTKLVDVVKTGTPKLGRLRNLGNTKILISDIPIIVDGRIVGAVSTFEDVTKIQEYEQKIRSKLMDKGYIAKYSLSDIIGKSEIIQNIKEKSLKYAATDSTVLIVGESGTGKEMFAQGIHQASKRKNGPFVAINCGALPGNLIESELFGYEEGAFTGASKNGKMGLFIEAHGGTIFLDEIGELPIELQARLLRVIQEREVRPVGSNRIIPINVRIIAATNKDLLKEIENKNFRSDLYYRLNILNIRVPTLVERKGDICIIFKHFSNIMFSKFNKKLKISEKAINKLEQYNWPGNIRELENITERLVVLAEDEITDELVNEALNDFTIYEDANINSLEQLKKTQILKVLSECEGNQTLAANKLEISRTHLWRLLKKYNLS